MQMYIEKASARQNKIAKFEEKYRQAYDRHYPKRFFVFRAV